MRSCCDWSGQTFAVPTRSIASKLAAGFEHDQARNSPLLYQVRMFVLVARYREGRTRGHPWMDILGSTLSIQSESDAFLSHSSMASLYSSIGRPLKARITRRILTTALAYKQRLCSADTSWPHIDSYLRARCIAECRSGTRPHSSVIQFAYTQACIWF